MTTMDTSTGAGERWPLSANQEFLCALDQGDAEGPFGPRHHIVHGWRIHGQVDVQALQRALDDIVVRHDALRSVIIRDPEARCQVVHQPTPAELTVRDLPGIEPEERGRRIDALLVEEETADFDASSVPKLRAVLNRFDDHDALLVLVVHHAAADGWSVQVIFRDLAARYATRTGHGGHELAEPQQYRDFTTWQLARLGGPAENSSRRYWQDKLRGGETVTMPADRPRSMGLPQTTAMYRFEVDAELMAGVSALAREVRGSSFMVLLAAFTIAVNRLSGATDIATPTLTPGREYGRFDEAVGLFFNFVPIRLDVTACAKYRDVLQLTRNTCLEAYVHDIPAIPGEAPEFMRPMAVDNEVPIIFQVFPFPFPLDGTRVGDLEYSEIRRRIGSQSRTSDIPDGVLWTLTIDTTGELIGNIAYKDGLVDRSSIAQWVSQFRAELKNLVTGPDGVVLLRSASRNSVEPIGER
ncbi:condensation domain-containing protein [Amycolatopsis plumensis]|uniref:Condensation domain-containing protein n=1 Tax=Amycolatopsis plumensis TaxID=236508 RepID=A0ABV5U7Y8_9PSEU